MKRSTDCFCGGREVVCAAPPPVGRAREIRRLIQGSSPKTCFETISGGEGGGWRGKWGGLFWATSLEKIFGGVIAISYPFGREHGRHRAMRRLRLNRAPSFQCRDVYQDCTPTHLHWFRTGMIRSWQPQDAKAISIEFPTSILLLRSMQNLSPSYREADAMMIAGHGWKRVANTLLKITLPLAAAIGAPLIAGSA